MRKSPIARGLLILFFGALLAVPFVMKRLHESGGASAAALASSADADATVGRYGFRLEEVSKQSGVNFTHTAPTLDDKLAHIMPQVAPLGAAVSVVDFDRDGWQALYVTNSGEGSLNALYRKKHDGTFEDVAAQLGVADVNHAETGVSMGAVWGDYDNNGYEDLFLYKWGRPELFHNDGGKGFTRVTEKAGLPQWANANTALWFDYDRDGKP